MGPILVAFVAVVIGAAIGFALGRYTPNWVIYGLWGILALVLLGLLLTGAGKDGWEGLAFYLMALIAVLPALLGTVAGGLIGLRRRRGAQDRP